MATPAVLRSQRGASAVEYGLLLALLAAVIFGVIVLFGDGVTGLFTNTHSSIVNHGKP